MAAMTAYELERMRILEKRYEELDERLGKMEVRLNSIFTWLKGLVIGLAIAALVFGWINVKQLIDLAK